MNYLHCWFCKHMQIAGTFAWRKRRSQRLNWSLKTQLRSNWHLVWRSVGHRRWKSVKAPRPQHQSMKREKRFAIFFHDMNSYNKLDMDKLTLHHDSTKCMQVAGSKVARPNVALFNPLRTGKRIIDLLNIRSRLRAQRDCVRLNLSKISTH